MIGWKPRLVLPAMHIGDRGWGCPYCSWYTNVTCSGSEPRLYEGNGHPDELNLSMPFGLSRLPAGAYGTL